MLKITGISVPGRSRGRARCWQPGSHSGCDPSTGIPELSSEQGGQGTAQQSTGAGQPKLQEPPDPVQGPPRAIWCPVSHRAASVEAGGLRWGDTRVKGVSEHLSLLLMQLYELDGDPRRKEFLDDLFSFMQKRGESPAARPPCAPVPTLCPPCSTTPTLHPPTSPPGLGAHFLAPHYCPEVTAPAELLVNL